MINPAEIPQIPGDLDALSGHASSLETTGSGFARTGAQVHATWQGLSGHYDAPEAAQLLNATQPVSSTAHEVGGNIETVGAALSTYAATVTPIKERLAALKTQAQAFVADAEGDDDWREDEDKVNEHNGMLAEVNQAVADWMAAQRTCANAINATYGGTHYVADNGDGHRAGNEFGYSAEQLDGALGDGQELPWGNAEEHDGGLLGDVGSFFGGIKDGAVNMVTDLGALIGRDPTTGDWSWGTAGQAWKGLGTFALALSPVALTINNHTDLFGLKKGTLSNTLLNAGKSIIAYDQWGKGDNSRAAGMATFNIVSAVVGTKGAGAGLKGTGAAIQGAKTSGTAARLGSGLVRAGEFVNKMPTVTEIASGLGKKLNIHVPNFGNTPAIATAGGPAVHHVDTGPIGPRGGDTVHMDSGPGPRSDGPTPSGPSPSGNPSVGDAFNGHRTDGPGASHHAPDTGIHSTPDTGAGDRTPDTGHTPNTGHTPDNGHAPDADGPGRDNTLVGDAHSAGNGNAPDGSANTPEGSVPDGQAPGTNSPDAHDGPDNGPSHTSDDLDGARPSLPEEALKPQMDADSVRQSHDAFEHEYQRILDERGIDRAHHDRLRALPSNLLTDAQLREVAEVRNAITADPGTVMSKVMNPRDVPLYLNNDTSAFGGNFKPNEVRGFVARAGDTSGLSTPADLRKGLALDDGAVLKNHEVDPNKPIGPQLKHKINDASWGPIQHAADDAYVMRWHTPESLNTAYGGRTASVADHTEAITGKPSMNVGDAPYMGNGYTKAGIPEFHAGRGTDIGQRAEIWRVTREGKEFLAGVFNSESGWVRVP